MCFKNVLLDGDKIWFTSLPL